MDKRQAMDRTQVRQVQEAAGWLWGKIQGKKRELKDLEAVLRALQGQCTHPGPEGREYRNSLTGKCTVCLYEFRTEREIDAVFSE